MPAFDEILTRLKTYLGFCAEADLAQALGVPAEALRDYRQRDVFPDHLVVALMDARPGLGIDYQYVMTGCHDDNRRPASADF